MSTSAHVSAEDLAKLTVAKLKALCKDRRITGYSKLGKAALLQKLAESEKSKDPAAVPVKLVQKAEKRSLVTNASTPQLPPTCLDISDVTSPDATEQADPARQPAHPGPIPAKPTHAKVFALRTETRQHIAIDASPPRTSQKRKNDFLPPPVILKPRLDGCEPKSRHSETTQHISSTSIKRFKPLTVRAPHPHIQGANKPLMHPHSSSSLGVSTNIVLSPGLDFPRSTLVEKLCMITLPPKASERKKVGKLAVILSALDCEDIRVLACVSRTLRYAVYLSAAHILKINFAGKRLDHVTSRHSLQTTNLWPYLIERKHEVRDRQSAYRNSFLGRFLQTTEVISPRLWTSPDDDRQATVAARFAFVLWIFCPRLSSRSLRFLVTRLWFALSVGDGPSPLSWMHSTVIDAVPMPGDELWLITVRPDKSNDGNERFLVLGNTCEVICCLPSGFSNSAADIINCIRADWAGYLAGDACEATPKLLERLSWANREEYDRGISKVWLTRLQGEGDKSFAKRQFAERYIMASVAANSFSGRWMSASRMVQEFDGFSASCPDQTGKHQQVNLYLPIQHHVESVHLSLTNGSMLHPAVAVVATPAREYYILRDNGMQIGVEEEGIAPVWMELLQCTDAGVPL